MEFRLVSLPAKSDGESSNHVLLHKYVVVRESYGVYCIYSAPCPNRGYHREIAEHAGVVPNCGGGYFLIKDMLSPLQVSFSSFTFGEVPGDLIDPLSLFLRDELARQSLTRSLEKVS